MGALILVAARRILRCSMWDLVPWPGIEPGLPALGVQSLSHWTTREVPMAESWSEREASSLGLCPELVHRHFCTDLWPQQVMRPVQTWGWGRRRWQRGNFLQFTSHRLICNLKKKNNYLRANWALFLCNAFMKWVYIEYFNEYISNVCLRIYCTVYMTTLC